jgi:NAD(P)-dependent dehydrogenase (short-subunit alcohol dehydrogenase family)
MSILTGKRALVTGASKGIGQAIALRLRQEGAFVVGTGLEKEAEVLAVDEYHVVDFLSPADLEAFARKVDGQNFDILINNAGINKISEFTKIDLTDFQNILQVNLVAPMLLCRAVIPGMKNRGWGRIVNISSIFGKISKELRAPYSATKFGLDGMTLALAAELGTSGILANCVAPGFIDTELTQRVLGRTGIETLSALVPLKRLGVPEEVAELVVWLVGPLNTYVNGQNIAIDGGFSRV